MALSTPELAEYVEHLKGKAARAEKRHDPEAAARTRERLADAEARLEKRRLDDAAPLMLETLRALRRGFTYGSKEHLMASEAISAAVSGE